MKKVFPILLVMALLLQFSVLPSAKAAKSSFNDFTYEEEPNDDRGQANLIEIEDSVYGEINNNDFDIYQIQVDYTSNLMLLGQGYDGNEDQVFEDGLSFTLIDEKGDYVAGSEMVDPDEYHGVGSSVVDVIVHPGTYYIAVESTNDIIREYTFSTEQRLGVNRLFGDTRYSTAVAISQAGWDSSDTAIITTGGNFPDALCAAPLAAKYNAPLFLTEPNVPSLNPVVKEELQRLEVKEVFIVGGTNAVSAGVESELVNSNIRVTRLSGANRYETAVKVAEMVGNTGEIALVTGRNFADALSMSAIAGAKGMPILLSDSNDLPSSVSTYLSKNNINKTYVIGGYQAISNSVSARLPMSERIYGDNRYATNRAIIQKFTSDLDFVISFIATGENFPDALSGSALAATMGAPVILTSTAPKGATMELIYENRMEIGGFLVLGGEGPLPNQTINELMNFSNPNLQYIEF